MKKLLLLSSLIITINIACRKSYVDTHVPVCISDMIEQNKGNAEWQIGSVDEYEFQGKIVYGLTQDNRLIADGGTFVVNDNCTTTCFVGGIAGSRNSGCFGENFFEKARLIRNIWKK